MDCVAAFLLRHQPVLLFLCHHFRVSAARREVVFLFLGNDGIDNLIQIEIGEKLRGDGVRGIGVPVGRGEEQTVSYHIGLLSAAGRKTKSPYRAETAVEAISSRTVMASLIALFFWSL